MNRRQLQAGFTLIEIMVVVFILGLLVTLVAPKIIGRTDQARITKAKADIKLLSQSLDLFKLDHGAYPTTAQGLEILITPSPRSPDGYLDKVPNDPWDHPYVFMSDGRSFVIKSYGADGAEGGDEKNQDIDSRDIS